jgi:chromosomal replication initiation ATPase DnaA
MSVIESLHQAHKARLKRMAARGVAQANAGTATRVEPGAQVTDARLRARSRRASDPDYERAWAAEIMGVVEGDERRSSRPRIVDIQRATARHYGLALNEMLGEGRMLRIAIPRHIAMYLARELTLKSHPQIGRMFAGRDHSTVVHAVNAIKARLLRDPELADHVASIRAGLERKRLSAAGPRDAAIEHKERK